MYINLTTVNILGNILEALFLFKYQSVTYPDI